MNNIKKLRISFGYTQQELADKMQLSKSTIAMLENGSRLPSIDTLVKLSNIFNASTDYVLGNTTMKNPKKYLENELSNLNLNSKEYDAIMNDVIQKQDIKLINPENVNINNLSKEQKVNLILSEVYVDYLKSNAIDWRKEKQLHPDLDFANPTDKEFDFIKKHNEPIDESFFNVLKKLDKNKILHKEQSNVFPTTDIPQKYPVLGKISAGLPLLAVENIEGYMYAPSSKIQQGYDYFFLRVQRR